MPDIPSKIPVLKMIVEAYLEHLKSLPGQFNISKVAPFTVLHHVELTKLLQKCYQDVGAEFKIRDPWLRLAVLCRGLATLDIFKHPEQREVATIKFAKRFLESEGFTFQQLVELPGEEWSEEEWRGYLKECCGKL